MTWILAGATLVLLSSMVIGYHRADRDRCRAAHPTARPVLYPLRVAVNSNVDLVRAPSSPGRDRHLEVVRNPR